MSHASSRIQRLLRLITLLQSGRARGVAELAEEMGVSRRTLFRDLNVLGRAGIPYYHDPDAGYRIRPSFYLPPIHLSVPETLGLLLLAKAASAQRGRPLAAPAISAINKLTSTVPEPIRASCLEMVQNVSIHPGPQGNGDAEARNYALLHRCIDEGRACRLRYDGPYDGKTIETRFDPYLLHFSKRAWYAIGRSELHGEPRVFKLARIVELEPMKVRFDRPRGYRAEDKLGLAWEMIPEGGEHRVELEFSPKVAQNVTEVLWHRTQKNVPLPGGGCRVSFLVDGVREIAWWVCGYAGEVKVVAPTSLRKLVRDMHRAAVERV